MAAIDVAYKERDGGVHVLDWKTGRERGVDHVQVGTYALYAHRKWNVPVDAVALYWHLVDMIWIFLFPLLYLI